MKFISILALTFVASQSFADLKINSVDDIVSMQKNAEGTYDVVCEDNTNEVVTELDIQLNNVCPHKPTKNASNILSAQRRSDGQFNVICTDLSRVVATARQIIDGEVCQHSLLMKGVYDSDKKWLSCNAEYFNNNGIFQVKLTFETGHILADCVSNVCYGTWSTMNSYKYRITILNNKSFELVYLADPNNETNPNYRTIYTLNNGN